MHINTFINKNILIRQNFCIFKQDYNSSITEHIFSSWHLPILMAAQITAAAFSFEKQDVSLTALHFSVYAATLWR